MPETQWLHLAAPAGSLRTTLLVRPDGHIAWAADDLDDLDTDGLRAELERWPAADR
ncbi:hypothetical protein ACFWIO_18450 [Streptomyces diastatochromogenes]|uniref:aromatic-ring hydroxylase C-terminal domain-containing protein n=1 Tax=Streptomyces diastatochromogenes TaxID=42236 RepID=UPI0036662703